MNKKKRILLISILILFVLLIGFMLFNRSFVKYYIDKAFLSPARLIETYTEIALPDNVIVNSIEFSKDIPGDILTEVLEAKITLGEAYAEQLFSNSTNKDYEYLHVAPGFIRTFGFSEDDFDYMIFRPYGVSSGFVGTQRSIYFIILKPIDGATAMCVYIDKLGWTK